MGTEFLEIILTVKMALGTKAALFKTTGGVRTKAGDRTVTPVGAVIERASKAAGLLEKHMVADFLEIVVQSRPRVLPISLKEAEASSRVLIVKRSSKDKCLCLFIVVSSFISAAQEDDTLKNVRLKSTLSFVRITSMVKRRRGGI